MMRCFDARVCCFSIVSAEVPEYGWLEMSNAKQRAEEIIEQMRAMGGIPPKLQPAPENVKGLNIEGVDVPPVIEEFLSRFDSHVVKVLEPGVLLWECDMDGNKLRQHGIHFMDFEAMYFAAIRKAGGAFINRMGLYHLMFPQRTDLLRGYFEKAGFGLDDFVDPLTGRPLIEDANSPERVRQRIDGALSLFDEMMNECPSTLTGISATYAWLKTLTPPTDKKWVKKWAEKVWAYYEKHKSSAMYQPRQGASDWYSRTQCLREAGKGFFHIGGFP